MRNALKGNPSHTNLIKWLTYVMFLMFAMTTDSVGVIIPEVIKQFALSKTAGGAFHYTTMTAIALAAIGLGFLADKLGRKNSILLGLTIYSLSSYLFVAGNSFGFFLLLLTFSGAAIGIFKTGALALISDISRSTTEHTTTMNMVEGFFGVGAIIGPALVAFLLRTGVAWKGLYLFTGTLSVTLFIIAWIVKYPQRVKTSREQVRLAHTLKIMKNPFALAFSLGAFLYVAVECAVYVWMPTLVSGYTGRAAFLTKYGISLFFIFRAGGRFLGAWVLAKFEWTTVLMLFSLAILLCFVGSVFGGLSAAIFLLPLSGAFMSMLYPTINSKGMSCFPKNNHGAIAGVILFASCAAAALGPLAMGAVGDAAGDMKWGFVLATGFAALLFAGALVNWLYNPTLELLRQLDRTEYNQAH